jgi:hypothetical protein
LNLSGNRGAMTPQQQLTICVRGGASRGPLQAALAAFAPSEP